MSSQASQAGTASQPLTMKQIIAPLVAIIVGMFMVILDGTAMNVAMPNLVKDFESTIGVVQWTVTGYALAQSAVIPLAGWLSDRFGAKRIFLLSVVLFTLGSGLCALATNAGELIAYRIVQGLGGGMVAPIAMAFTYRLSPPGKVGAVMGMIGIPMLLAPALGPVVSGWLVDYVTWHWIFLINLPIGVVAVIVGLRTLPKLDRQSVPALDFLGIIFAPVAFAALAYGVSEGGTSWTSTKTIAGLVIGGVALILFIIVELRRTQPLLELRVFKSANFTRGIVVQWISQIALFGTIFMVPLFLQQAKGYSAFDTGLIMLPQAIAAGVFMPIGGRLYDKIGARPVVISGMALITIAAYVLSTVSTETSLIMVMLPLAMIGAGMGLSMMPLNTHIIQSAPPELVSRVTSLTAAAQQVMSSFAVAGLATMLTSRVEHYMGENPADPSAVMSSSYGDTFFLLTGIAIVGAVVGLLLRRPKQQPQGAEKPDVSMMMGH